MKYTTVRVELRVRHPDFKINQTNIIVGCPWRIQQRTERATYHPAQRNCYKKSVSAMQRLSCCVRLVLKLTG